MIYWIFFFICFILREWIRLMTIEGKATNDPVTVMKHKGQLWSSNWREQQGHPADESLPMLDEAAIEADVQGANARLRELRTLLGNHLPEPTEEDVLQGFGALRESAGRGADAMRPSDDRQLPKVALRRLAKLWAVAESAWTWPWHYLSTWLEPGTK